MGIRAAAAPGNCSEMALGDARRGIEDLREIAAGIHPAVLSQRGLAAAIDALTARLPIPVQLEVPERRLPAPIEASVYFFCSEALTNVVKHARATSAWVRLELGDDRCAVEVRDDGIGGAQPRSEMSGLNGLRDRIGALNGTMDITSPATGGTVLQASIPLPSELRATARGSRMHADDRWVRWRPCTTALSTRPAFRKVPAERIAGPQ